MKQVVFDAQTGETIIVEVPDIEIQTPVQIVMESKPTVEELQEQINALQSQLNEIKA